MKNCLKLATTILLPIAAGLLTSPALAQVKNNTPHALACMKKAGITYAGWRSGHAGTQAQVDRYIACRDRKQ